MGSALSYKLLKPLLAGIALSALTPLAVGTTPGASDISIASKLEDQGKMSNLKVTDLRATKQDNLLRIQAEITNLKSGNQQLYYRFKWLDSDGFVVWDEEPWKPMLLYGNQKQVIKVGSPTFKATDFRLILQSSDSTND